MRDGEGFYGLPPGRERGWERKLALTPLRRFGISTPMTILSRWRDSFRHRPELDLLLTAVPAEIASLQERLEWLRRLVNWIRVDAGDGGSVQSTRLKYILQVLDRNAGSREKVSECLRSLLRDTRALELFMHVGVPNQQGFIGEFIERLTVRLLPQAPDNLSLEFIFSETFRHESDAEWIEKMDPAVFRAWLELFQPPKGTLGSERTKIRRDIQDALFLLTHSVRSIGLSRIVRRRVAETDFRKSPFFHLTADAEALIEAPDHATRERDFAELGRTLDRCFSSLEEVYAHYRAHGASIELVYQTERLKMLMKRCRTLGKLLASDEQDLPFIQDFFSLLVRENVRARKLSKLLADNLALVCQKIVETNAETGEHYITRDREDLFKILKKSWGGGAVTGLTTLVKYMLAHLSMAPFFSGIFAVANYFVSFLALQFLGYTLATKQPAMTATVLAAKIEESGDTVSPLIDEIVHLVRSQLAAVVGNLSMVVPVVLLIDFLYTLSFGSHLTDAVHAHHSIESFSILGPTPIYAAGTGVLLWLSSVFAGWFGNWFVFRGLPSAIEHNARLKFVLGPLRAHRLGEFLEHNVPGIAANLSLAILLGMTPQFAAFFGFPFDVRHVTLSSGTLAASVSAIGPHILQEWSFWLAVSGILSMGVLNLAVSFALALTVAIWAKKVSSPKRGVIYRALLSKFLQQPWIFLFPARS
jgi:site-specific recombinase